MSNYEILLVVRGDLGKKEAKDTLKDLVKIVNKNKDFKETELGLKDLAYKIEGFDKGWYIQLNFSTKIPSEIAEFNRLAKLNKDVIRFLVINLDKDYGARALANPKKVKKAQRQANIYKKKMERKAAVKELTDEVKGTVENQAAEVKNNE
ncbi:MAG: 30S ribosomal protein S6 [Mycoplasma sp.]|nr:30S ribosomal protein S6 [Mycoplasma sp.]